MTPCCPTLAAALALFLDRAAQVTPVDADTHAGQYALGRADAYADAAGLLEHLVSPGWPEQSDEHPYDLAIGDAG